MPGSRTSARALHVLAAALFLGGQAALLLSHARHASVTTDEFGHLPLALAWVRTGIPEFLLMNPPSGPALAALAIKNDPAARLDPNLLAEGLDNNDREFWTVGARFQQANLDHYARLYDRPRLVIIALALCCSLLAYALGRALGGPAAGLVALFLMAFSPDFLAHGSLVTTDLAAALAALAAITALIFFIRRPLPPRLLACGAAVSLLLLGKHSDLIFLPLVPAALWMARREPALLPGRRAGRALLELAAVAFMAWLLLVAAYGWGGLFVPLGDFDFTSDRLLALAAAWPSLPVPLPAAWLSALDLQLFDAARPWPIYFMGELRLRPSHWYYPAAFALKEPLPLLCLLLLIPAGYFADRRPRPALDHGHALLVAAGVFFFAAMCLLPGKQYGIRLLLPGVGILLVIVGVWVGRALSPPALAAGAETSPDSKRKLIKAKKILIYGLLIWYAADTLAAAPHFLGYFNEIAGGPRLPHQGHLYLADSNLDWGQDWKALAKWQAAHGGEPRRLARFGMVDPAAFGVKYEEVACPLPAGQVAVSANILLGIEPFRGGSQCLRDLRHRVPDGRVGASIFIFNLP